jgi:hypothetical protein
MSAKVSGRGCAGAVAVASLMFAAAVNVADAQPKVPIRLELTCERSGNEVTLTATFKNEGLSDSALVIGHATGKTEAADSLVLEMRAAGSGLVEEATYADALYVVFGRLDPLIVPLPKQSRFTLVRRLGLFFIAGQALTDPKADRSVRMRLRSPPEGYVTSQAAGIISDRLLTRELFSQWVHIPNDCSAAPGLH